MSPVTRTVSASHRVSVVIGPETSIERPAWPEGGEAVEGSAAAPSQALAGGALPSAGNVWQPYAAAGEPGSGR